MQEFGKWLYFGGIALMLLGALINVAPRLFIWFGKLPGDLKYQKKEGQVRTVPLTSLAISAVLVAIAAKVVEQLFGGN